MTLRASLLAVGYSGRPVLTGIDLELASGCITVLLGPNGSGKSTLIRTLLGQLEAISGTIELGGKPLSSMSEGERARVMTLVPPEEKPEFPFLIREVVMMGRLPYANTYFDSAQDRQVVEEAMATMECGHLADRPIAQVSAGERQRALIARSLAQQAPIMLMDEPTSHLDPAHQVSFARLCRSLADSGKSLLVAVHDLNLALEIADQALLVANGKVVAYGRGEVVLTPESAAATFGVQFKSFDRTSGARLWPTN